MTDKKIHEKHFFSIYDVNDFQNKVGVYVWLVGWLVWVFFINGHQKFDYQKSNNRDTYLTFLNVINRHRPLSFTFIHLCVWNGLLTQENWQEYQCSLSDYFLEIEFRWKSSVRFPRSWQYITMYGNIFFNSTKGDSTFL